MAHFLCIGILGISKARFLEARDQVRFGNECQINGCTINDEP